MQRTNYLLLGCIISLVFGFSSCSNMMDYYTTQPEWFKGSAMQYLSNAGKFKYFIEAVKRSGYQDIIEGKGINTVMAPTDSAFIRFFKSRGIEAQGLDGLTDQEIKTLVGYHIVWYSFSAKQFADYQPNGVEVEGRPGVYYKFRTRARDAVSTEFDNIETKKEYDVFHYDKLLPIFSKAVFLNKWSGPLDPKKNYEFYYPTENMPGGSVNNAPWDVDNATIAGRKIDGFMVSNAGVQVYQEVTENGYVYVLNRVIDPLQTIYNKMQTDQNYTRFVSLYDRFRVYDYDRTATENFAEVGKSLYIMSHMPLPSIGSEWPSMLGNNSISLPLMASGGVTLFPPTNEALNEFFNLFWKDYSESGTATFDSISNYGILYMLYNHTYQASSSAVVDNPLVFPDEITKGKIISHFGTPISFDPYTDSPSRFICANGALIGLNKVLIPDMFKSVIGQVFRAKKYSIFLHMIMATDVSTDLTNNELEYTMFIPTDNAVQIGMIKGEQVFYSNPTPELLSVRGKITDYLANFEGQIGAFNSERKPFVQEHAIRHDPLVPEFALPQTEGQVTIYPTVRSNTYIFASKEGVAGTKMMNQKVLRDLRGTTGGTSIWTMPKLVNSFTGENRWSNGKVYELDEMSLVHDHNTLKKPMEDYAKLSINFPDFTYAYEFGKALKAIKWNTATDYLGGAPFFGGTAPGVGQKYIVLMPSDEAMKKAYDDGTLPAVLKNWAGGTFSSANTNTTKKVIARHVYSLALNDGLGGTYPMPQLRANGKTMKSIFNPSSLSTNPVKEADAVTAQIVETADGKMAFMVGGTTYNVLGGGLPFVYDDCVVYVIDAVIEK